MTESNKINAKFYITFHEILFCDLNMVTYNKLFYSFDLKYQNGKTGKSTISNSIFVHLTHEHDILHQNRTYIPVSQSAMYVKAGSIDLMSTSRPFTLRPSPSPSGHPRKSHSEEDATTIDPTIRIDSYFKNQKTFLMQKCTQLVNSLSVFFCFFFY